MFKLHPSSPPTDLGDVTWVPLSAFASAVSEVDSFIIFDPIYDAPFWVFGRTPPLADLVRTRGIPMIFHQPYALFPDLRDKSCIERARQQSIPYDYCVQSGLNGHFLEFGTWFGRNIFKFYGLLSEQLKGNFYAFNSFSGLSEVTAKEEEYCAAHCHKGYYFCNLESFNMIREQLSIGADRVVTVPGFYEHSIRGRRPQDFGIEPKSVSVCLIDCDLFQPTVDVLDFVFDALDDGCLLYFDDLRLVRAADKAGEYDAMRRWLKKHPEVGLVELFKGDWHSQWYIFNRYTS